MSGISDDEYDELVEMSVQLVAAGLRRGMRAGTLVAFLQVVVQLPARVSQPEAGR